MATDKDKAVTEARKELRRLFGVGGIGQGMLQEILNSLWDAARANAIEECAKAQWISVDERLPEITKPDKSYSAWHGLVFTGNYVCQGSLSRTYKQRKLTWKDGYGYCIPVTHWMPFPESPRSLSRKQEEPR